MSTAFMLPFSLRELSIRRRLASIVSLSFFIMYAPAGVARLNQIFFLISSLPVAFIVILQPTYITLQVEPGKEHIRLLPGSVYAPALPAAFLNKLTVNNQSRSPLSSRALSISLADITFFSGISTVPCSSHPSKVFTKGRAQNITS